MKGIIFSGESVLAIMDGRKTMTRRVIKFPPSFSHADFNIYGYEGPVNGKHLFTWGRNINGAYFDGAVGVNQPYSEGDVLWVREKWRTVDYEYHDCKWSASIEYADGSKGLRVFWYNNTDLGIPDDCIYSKTGWQPPRHMPREAARLFLRVTDVRVERVQDISTSNCEREGIASDIDRFNGLMTPHHDWIVGEFARLWDTINAKRGYGWDSNPWVWVYEFERVERGAEL